MEMTFFNILDSSDKNQSFLDILKAYKNNQTNSSTTIINPELIKSIEGVPFAYYAPIRMLILSSNRQILSKIGITAHQGIGASAKFHRLIWEIPSSKIGSVWIPMAHGTSPSKFYKPTTHLFKWQSNGKEAKADILQRYPYLNGNYGFKIQAENYYEQPGLCYGKRTENFTVQILPSGHVFSFEGTAIFNDESHIDYWTLLAFLNSSLINHWLSIVCAEHKAYNYVDTIPFPSYKKAFNNELANYAKEGWTLQRKLDTFNITSPIFETIFNAPYHCSSLKSLASSLQDLTRNVRKELWKIQQKIDKLVFETYEINEDISFVSATTENQDFSTISENSTCLNFYVCNLIDYLFGIVNGRWDIRKSILDSTQKVSSAFEPLPACSPAILQSPNGLPALTNNIVSEEWLRARPNANSLPPEGSVKNPTIRDEEYPIRISWEGILIDDAFAAEGNTHQEDILRRTREVIEVLWKERAPAIEQEACEILGVKSLRDYFRKPGGFFQDHLKRYSKSRRQAPIYWPLSSENGNYTLWIYYHRLTDQFLYTCVNDYVNPRIEEVTRDIEQLQKRQLSGAIRSADSLKQLEALQDFKIELANFRDELLAVAQLPYKPDLNDGVIITAAPLWKLFRLPKWRKDLKACWEKLQAGDYDWAHLTLAIWPDRVRAKCVTDKSLAIAHDLEHLYDESRAPRRKRTSTIEEENEEESIDDVN